MKIISRYLLKTYGSILSIALFGFLGLYLVIDVFEKVDDILEKQASLGDALQYFALKIPFIVTEGIPIAVLLATLITFGVLQRNREIVAFKAAGLSLATYGGPIVMATLVLAVGHIVLGENLARGMNVAAQKLWLEKIDRSPKHLEWKHENVWYHGQGTIYQIRIYDTKAQTFHNVSLFFLDQDFKLQQRLDARALRWEAGRWIAEDGAVLDLNHDPVEQSRFQLRRLELEETPEDFASLDTLPEEMDTFQLYRYVKKTRDEGYSPTALEVELNYRLAFPLTSIILAVIGMAISLKQGVHGRIASGIGLALAAGTAYLGLLQVGTALASAGILPPITGVWTGNLIFSALGIYLWIAAPQ
ncbi:MAG: LPS export ABC transporter permease LptG [Syntrophobacteraceae bacterium CG07_land_8_20_14_0_80_61_8]|nr:MAG: LPS export ABC transporter permease LptG [Syntrophobacteraceae bacterium CG07_land_8_20_14_0_80_61_8]